ncbi:MAG: serine/threonine-protein kinase [Actinomycetes bacterium]
MTETRSGAVLAGRYQLADRIGTGGMAEVFRAEDVVLERPVAVKMLHPGIDAGAARERLRSEVRLLARMSHPGLVSVYDAGDQDDRGFVVMQLVEGGTLAERLAVGALARDEVTRLASQLAEVLAYLHSQNLVHRDLKPSNVLLGSSGRVLLTDFGIARMLDAAHVTATDTTVGTAAYMAPEQVQGRRVGPAADVYALGLILIQCLTGEPVYAGSNTFEVASARLHRSPQIPRLAAGAPFSTLLESMTRLEPEQRPTANETATALRDQVPGTAPGSGAPVDGPDTTAVLPTVPPDERGPVSALGGLGDRVRTGWSRRPRAVPGRHTLASSPAAGRLREVWQHRDTPVLGVRADLALGVALGLLVLLVLILVAAGQDAPSGAPAPAEHSTVPPGAERLPADLDRLDDAVRR